MMKNLKAKLNKQGGFTLIEMLIVVAIIAILIAIAIPMVNKALENAREATDEANQRAALGLAMVEVLAENKLAGTDLSTVTGTKSVSAYYKIDPDGKNGSLVKVADKPTSAATGGMYGKATAVLGNSSAVHVGKTIKVTYYLDADTFTKEDGTTENVIAGDFRTSWE